MTIDEAIFQVDSLKPNQIERAQKISWLSQLDSRIFHEIMGAHVKDASVPEDFPGYHQDTAPDTVLLAKAPYEEMYRFFLEMQIDLTNLEYDKFNNSAMLFENAWGQYARAYHREHMPLSQGAFHRF